MTIRQFTNVKFKQLKQMEIKKYLSLLLLVIAVCAGFSSCSDDDKDEPQTGISQIIIGEWDTEFLGDVSEINTTDLDVDNTKLGTVDSRIVFNSNGTGYEIDLWDDTRYEFSYTVSGNIVKASFGNNHVTQKIIKYSDNVIYSILESQQTIHKMVKRK